jgi:hypothetical protein
MGVESSTAAGPDERARIRQHHRAHVGGEDEGKCQGGDGAVVDARSRPRK